MREEAATEYGADGYGKNASSAVRAINNIIALKRLASFSKIIHDRNLHNFDGLEF